MRRAPTSLPTVPGRRALLAAAGLALALALPRWAVAAPECQAATDWADFAARHIQPDGRVIDFNTPQQQSTSEGQSYSLFFALVHNDRATFARVLAWTQGNLAGGSLSKRLPSWQWGRKPEGGWGVLDANSASDSDLWIAYALMEAGRLWNDAGYRELGRDVLARVAKDEVISLSGLGRMLLPWPKSVASGPVYRLNPSYLPLQLLRYFELADSTGPWHEIAENTVRMIAAIAPKGFAPDWCGWSEDSKAFVADPLKGTAGSYDAIRVYLWAGMLNAKEPARMAVLQSLHGPRTLLDERQLLPESVDTATGAGKGMAPLGFSGALLPYLKALGDTEALKAQVARMPGARADTAARPAAATPPLPYYEQILLLFGQAWLDGRYEFARNGQLQPQWRTLCRPTRLA